MIRNQVFTEAIRWHLLAFLLMFFTSVNAQGQGTGGPVHLKVKRLNDTYIDVYHNTPALKKPGDKMPLLIFCQGSGYDSNTEGFLGLVGQFSSKAVGLAIEKQGVQYGDKGDKLTEEYRKANSVHNRLYDYLRVLQYLRGHAKWWNGAIYVIGGSEGGLLAGMLASFYPNTKAVAIFSFGGGLNFGEAWPISIGLQKKAEGATAAQIEAATRAVQDTFALIRQNGTWQQSYEGADNTYAWWTSIMDLRLENALLDLSIPIYVAQGTADVMAPPVSAQTLHQHFVQQGKTNLLYKEYPGYDHGFTDQKGDSHLVEVLSEAIRWILRK